MSFARRIVIDTGVLVSAALRPDSVPALAVEKALLYFEVCASDETWAEFETVLLLRCGISHGGDATLAQSPDENRQDSDRRGHGLRTLLRNRLFPPFPSPGAIFA
jgi:hypothetical protein